jgi:hypothetical protein
MKLRFEGPIWYWKGPAPHYFVTVPANESSDIRRVSSIVSYGWGMVPVHARIGKTRWKTSLFAKDGCYVLPIKMVVRKAEQLDEGAAVAVQMEIVV